MKFPNTVTPNDIVVDCGAAEGLFSLKISQIAKKIYAIEPLPMFVKCMNLSFKKVDNIEVIDVALGSSEAESWFTEEGLSSSLTKNSELGVKVSIRTLDSLFLDTPITYIKADLEGHELELLEGATHTIKKYCPKIAITTYHQEDHARKITEFLKQINPSYNIKVKGIEDKAGAPVMLHAWV